MKKLLSLTLLVCALCTTQMIGQIRTPSASPSSTLTQTIGLSEVTIEYSRPAKKGRTIFGAEGLVPTGKVWRTGANQATKITFSDDMTVGGSALKAGSYAILTIPNGSKWAVHFYNHESTNWSSYVEKTPALIVEAAAVSLPMTIESFTINIMDVTSNSATLGIIWDQAYVPLELGAKVDEVVMAAIDKTLAGPTTGDYYAAGSYYHDSGKDLNKALKWVQMATKTDSPRYWQVRKESLILADLGKFKEAIAAAKQSLALATEADNADYVKMNTDSIAKWMKK